MLHETIDDQRAGRECLPIDVKTQIGPGPCSEEVDPLCLLRVGGGVFDHDVNRQAIGGLSPSIRTNFEPCLVEKLIGLCKVLLRHRAGVVPFPIDLAELTVVQVIERAINLFQPALIAHHEIPRLAERQVTERVVIARGGRVIGPVKIKVEVCVFKDGNSRNLDVA